MKAILMSIKPKWCEKIISFSANWINGVSRAPIYINGTCITGEQLFDYSKGKRLYGLHIAEPKQYETPKELEVFWTVRCTNKTGECKTCKVKPACISNVTRAPQSFMYVEEIEK